MFLLLSYAVFKRGYILASLQLGHSVYKTTEQHKTDFTVTQ